MPTRKRKTGAEPASNGPACGDCIWWVPDEGEPSHGYCHVAPPVPVMDGDGEAYGAALYLPGLKAEVSRTN